MTYFYAMRYFIASLFIIGLISCDNTVDILDDPKDIPIVYGVLSAVDTTHYIRVEKAFASDNVSALDLARDPASLYYDNAIVTLVNGGERFDLERIDATLDGYPRQQGVFAETPNILYKIRNSDINLKEGATYRLEIDRGIESLPIVSASTTIVAASEIRTPRTNVNFDNSQFTNFSWREGDFSSIFDLYLDFNYRERVKGSGDPYSPKVVRWKVASDIETPEADVQGIQFYSFLAGAIAADDNIERIFVDIDLILDSGSSEIKEFIRVSEANLGITSSQDIPTFSNLSEGRGLFGSLYREVKTNVQLTNKSLDSLKMGSITGNLNFN